MFPIELRYIIICEFILMNGLLSFLIWRTFSLPPLDHLSLKKLPFPAKYFPFRGNILIRATIENEGQSPFTDERQPSFTLKHSWTVEQSQEDIQLSAFLKLVCPSEFASDTASKKAVRRGIIRVNNVKTKLHSTLLKEGDNVALYVRTMQGTFPTAVARLSENMNQNASRLTVPVLWEDDHCAVVIKPQGMCVFAGNINQRESTDNGAQNDTSKCIVMDKSPAEKVTLQTALLFSLKPIGTEASVNPLQSLEALRRPQPVHRLDQGTGGLILVAKTRPALRNLTAQFAGRAVDKRYLAIVAGKLDASTKPKYTSADTFQSSLSDLEVEQSIDCHAVISQPLSGQTAVTELWVRHGMHMPSKTYGFVTTVNLIPHTGRTHQLRRHLDMIGHPILGDPDYWFSHQGVDRSVEHRHLDTRPPRLEGRGMFLWSVGIAFNHPVSGERISLSLAEPESFAELRQQLICEEDLRTS